MPRHRACLLACARVRALSHPSRRFIHPPCRAAQGKRLVFVTNNSTKSRAGYTSKFKSLGLNVTAEEIFSSSFAAAAYLESTNFPKDKKARDMLAGTTAMHCEACSC